MLLGIIRKGFTCGINASKWPLSQLVLMLPFSTGFLGTSQLRWKAEKVVKI